MEAGITELNKMTKPMLLRIIEDNKGLFPKITGLSKLGKPQVVEFISKNISPEKLHEIMASSTATGSPTKKKTALDVAALKVSEPQIVRSAIPDSNAIERKLPELDISAASSTKEIEMRMGKLETSVKELQQTVEFLRKQWLEAGKINNTLLNGHEIKDNIRVMIGKLDSSWQSIDNIWHALPQKVQVWEVFQALIEELSDEQILGVNAGESAHQVVIRGESYGVVRRLKEIKTP